MGKKSTAIFCSQYEFEEWYDQLGGDASPLADAIINRIAHDSYRINITSYKNSFDFVMLHLFVTNVRNIVIINTDSMAAKSGCRHRCNQETDEFFEGGSSDEAKGEADDSKNIGDAVGSLYDVWAADRDSGQGTGE